MEVSILKKLEAVIFDFDGTIINTEQTYYEVVSELVKKYSNRELEKLDYIYNVSGTSVEQCKKYIMQKYDMSEETYDKLNTDLVENHYHKFVKSKVLPYIEETFALLKENHIKIGVASNGTLEHIIDGLKENHLYHYVDDIVTKYDVDKGKPAPDIYLAAADRLGVDIKNCIAVEDSLAGATSAVLSGAYLILQTNDITKHFNFDAVKYQKRDCNLYEEIKNIIGV